MAFEQIRDVLDRTVEIHGRISELYDRLGDKAQRPRVRMLLDYLSRHEKHLQESLAIYEHEVSGRVLDCWCRDIPHSIPSDCFECSDLSADMSIDEVINVAVRLDYCLIKLYEAMADCAPYEDVREVFKRLLEMEEREEVEMIRNALQLKEI